MELKQKTIYWCKTIEDAMCFAKKCDDRGWAWSDGKKVSEQLMYDTYGEYTCYKTNCGKITFGHKDYYESIGRKVQEFKLDQPKIEDGTKFYYAKNKLSFFALLNKLSGEGCYAYLESYDIILAAKDIVYTWEYQKENTIVIRYPNGRILLTTKEYKEKNFPEIEIIESEDFDMSKFKVGGIAIHNGIKCIIDSIDETCFTARIIYKNGESSRQELVSLSHCESGDITGVSDGEYIIDADGDVVQISEVREKYAKTMSATFLFAEDINLERTQKAKSLKESAVPVGKIIREIGSRKNVMITEHTSVAYKVQDICGDTSFIPYDEEVEVQADAVSYKKDFTAVVSDDRLTAMVDRVMDVFKSHKYGDVTPEGVKKFLEAWNKNKSWLANLLRKHPNWNEENLCVTSIEDDVRVAEKSKKSSALSDFASFVGGFLYYSDKTKIYRAMRDLFTSSKFVECVMAEKITPEFSELFKQTLECRDIKLKMSCNIGAKPTRVISAFCRATNIDKLEGYEREFAKLSDCISSATFKRRFVLSVNPIDFLLMSNGNSWSSCHYLDGGNSNKCYQAGTMSYAEDSTSLIFYAINKNSKTPFCMAPKERRQIFCYSGLAILQSRLYPSYTDTKFYSTSMNYITEIISKCDGYSEAWISREIASREHKKFFITANGYTHYPDYTYSDFNPQLNVKAQAVGVFVEKAVIGGKTICPVCGKQHSEHHDCRCVNCYPR